MRQYGVQWYGADVRTESMTTGNALTAEEAISIGNRFKNAVAVAREVGEWEPVKVEVESSGGEVK